jgi:hypothetical protein
MEAKLVQVSKSDRWKSDSLVRAATKGETPLGYMLRVMRDSTADNVRRDEMAKAAAPYTHAKLAATEVKEVTRFPNQSVEELREELLADMVEAGLVTLVDEHTNNVVAPEAMRRGGGRRQ